MRNRIEYLILYSDAHFSFDLNSQFGPEHLKYAGFAGYSHFCPDSRTSVEVMSKVDKAFVLPLVSRRSVRRMA